MIDPVAIYHHLCLWPLQHKEDTLEIQPEEQELIELFEAYSCDSFTTIFHLRSIVLETAGGFSVEVCD